MAKLDYPAKHDYPALVRWANIDTWKSTDQQWTNGIPDSALPFIRNLERIRASVYTPAVAAAYAALGHYESKPDDLFLGADKVEEFTKRIAAVRTGVTKMFASVVIDGWTAFEVLAGDLWVDTVNRFPLLGVRALDAEPLPSDSEQQRASKEKKTFEIVAQRLLDPKFDVKASMGDTLSDDFPMTKFRLIVKAYQRAFRNDAVKDIISHRDIRSLSAVRNALVHRAGVADHEFKEQIAGDPRFVQVEETDPVVLDGPTTVELIAGMQRQGFCLIKFVEDWCDAARKADSSTGTAWR